VGHMEDMGRWPDGCGAGQWCPRCREEIREEALRWLRELNVGPEPAVQPDGQVILTRWHRQWILTTRPAR
jgi:hypothetical protein